ncbi:MAG: YbaK/EbsC family protein [Frankiales bacterium]|jgi:prolyl-tRNA editing enzyme YbaK/EbsC (Cys-tRNA(Pro) deacylase)|nr:YbaK/EbsC family protein [Frankiales bacterium]
MKGTDRVLAALQAKGVHPDVRRLEDSTRTAKAAAAALGCEVGAIASSLFFLAGDEPLLVMTSGAHRVDERRVGELVGAPLRRATPDEVRVHTGFAIGGVAPVGHPAPLRTLVDVALRDHPVVWAAAGHPHAVFPTTYEEILTLTNGTAAVVGD